MCCKGSGRSKALPSGSFAKIAIVLIVVCYTQYSEGGSLRGQTVINKKKISACLNYGHSCWGAHGKRAQQFRTTPAREDLPVLEVPIDTRWFLSRIFPGYKGVESAASNYREIIRDNQELTELLKSISEDEESKDPTGLFYQDDPKVLRDNQLLKFLKNQKFDEVIHNN